MIKISDFVGNVRGKTVADLGTSDPGLLESLLAKKVAHCYFLERDTPVEHGSVTPVYGLPWEVQLPPCDQVYFDSGTADGFDHVEDLRKLAYHVKRVLKQDGVALLALQTGLAQTEWDVYNSILLTSNGPRPSSLYLFEELLKDFAVRTLARVKDPADPYTVTRLFRATPRRPTLLLVFAQSQGGKTTLARDLRARDRNAHVSSDYLFRELFLLKQGGAGRIQGVADEIVAAVGDGSGEAAGKFFRLVESDRKLFHQYLSVVLNILPRHANLVSVDLDLRDAAVFELAKKFFTEAGYSVWVVSR